MPLAQEEQPNFRPCRHITKEEVKEALRKMKVRKAVGPDNILVEIWKSLHEEGLEWLANFFNVIFESATMPQEWRYSILIPLYKSTGDAQDYNNYRGLSCLIIQ